jgi:hypothetical protein
MGQHMKTFLSLRKNRLGIIQIFLSFLGYAKIPREIVQVSLHQTSLLQSITKEDLSPRNREFVQMAVECSKAMTRFLSSGRML